MKKFHFIVITAFVGAAQGLRIVLRMFCDGTNLYFSYVTVSHMAFGIWILLFFVVCNRCMGFFGKIVSWKPIALLDGLSFYIYLVHSLFCRGKLNVYEYFDSRFMATAAFVMLSLTAAVILKNTVAVINRYTFQRAAGKTD